MNFKKNLNLPPSPFNRLFLFWGLFLLANLAFSQSIPNSLISLFPFSIVSNFQLPTSSSNFQLLTSNFEPGLPLPASWLIALSSMGASIKNAILGIGIGNFENAFTMFRPASFNSNELWFWNFNHSISPALTVLVEQGALGLGFWLFFFYKSYLSYKSYLEKDQNFFFPAKKRFLIKFFYFLIALSAILFLFSPIPLPYFPLISLIPVISLVSTEFLVSKPVPAKAGNHLSPLILPLALPLIALTVLFSIFSQKINPKAQMQIAENSLAEAQKLSVGNGRDRSLQLKIKTLSTTALSASSRAISLNPQNSAVHLNHLNLLTRLENLVENSDKLIASEFETLLKLDPKNPIVFRELGNFQFKNGDYFGSANSFKTAINLKADYSPAWWGAAQTYSRLAENAKMLGNPELEKQNLKLAAVALKETKRLVCEVHYEKVDCERVNSSLKNP